MIKNRPVRSMNMVSASQKVVEQAVIDKFASLEELVQPSRPSKMHVEATNKSVELVRSSVEAVVGRINPQLSCTIAPEDKDMLNELALYACNREKKMLNTSIIVRALIRLGNKYKDELVF